MSDGQRIRKPIKGWMSERIALILLDGKTRKLRDFYGYLKRNLDPRIAVSCYHRMRHSNTQNSINKTPLDHQLKLGTMRSINDSFRRMRAAGRIAYEGTVITLDTEVTLTPDGLAYYLENFTGIARMLRKLILADELHIHLELRGSNWEYREDEGSD